MWVSEIDKDHLTDEIIDKVLFEGIEDTGENADCIIVLGSNKAPLYRLPGAVKAYLEGRAPKILLSGGIVNGWRNNNLIIDNMAYMPYNAIRGKHMTEFTVIAYEKEDGESPVEDFINALDVKMRAKMYGLLSILQEKGNSLREPYSKHLDDGIFELRCKVGSNITRVLYFFYYERKIILTNGFVKKTQKTPPEEIRLAKERRADYIERMEQS